jgi:hypothetical protein
LSLTGRQLDRSATPPGVPRRLGHLSVAFDRTAAPRQPSADLDLRAIRCFLVLADERHYERAAQRLHMSQPGLSRTITALESRVGAILFVRNERPLGLTTQGEILAVHGRRLLRAQQAAFDAMVESAAGQPGSERARDWRG